ncbi:hypothetical protein DM860_004153 [Cuscuta australis]|uniref:RRM domain-containing protein n=1 Tax=Cuscuta australis TaxID=267555 RepID=A0A328CY46_9ASTE|nr:hypothetical protein DM860_004153 [Cuscuta australis]
MTIDDVSSIYVGGLPYSTTEESLREIFNIYGSVVDVKIINDQNVRGKCYGFVTFTNPRSAQQAIADMDGQTIKGRVIRVNDVRTRGRSNFDHQSSHRHTKRGLDSDKDSWERDDGYDYDRLRDGRRDRSRDRDHNREKGYPRVHNPDLERDYNVDRDKAEEYKRDIDFERERQRNHGDSFERIRDHRRKRQKNDDNRASRDNDLTSKLPNGSGTDHYDRDRSPESSEKNHDLAEKQLDVSNRKLEELQNEIPQIEEMVQEKTKLVSELHEKLQKLEDSLQGVKKLRSQRQLQVSKLLKCYLHVRDCGERLKVSEQELQSLVHSTMLDMECDGGFSLNDAF